MSLSKCSKHRGDLRSCGFLWEYYSFGILGFWRWHSCIVMYCCVLLCIVVYYCVLLCIGVYYCVLLCIVVYCCVLLCIVVYCCCIFLCCDSQCSGWRETASRGSHFEDSPEGTCRQWVSGLNHLLFLPCPFLGLRWHTTHIFCDTHWPPDQHPWSGGPRGSRFQIWWMQNPPS